MNRTEQLPDVDELRELRVVIFNRETQCESKVVRDVAQLALKATGCEPMLPGQVKVEVSNFTFLCANRLQAAIDLATVRPLVAGSKTAEATVNSSQTNRAGGNPAEHRTE